MWRRQRFFNWKVLLLTFTLNTFVRQTFSDNRLCAYNFKSVEVLHGQIVSERFHLTGPMLENHTLLWIIPNSGSMRCNSDLQCTTNDSFIRTRYRLINAPENTTNTFEVIIESAQEHDSGQHLIIVNEGRDKTCTALIFRLTVVNVDVVCTTQLDKEKELIQMTCLWMQLNKDDHAEFRAGKQVLFEDRTPDNTFRSNFNMTHQFSVYIDLQDIDTVEYVCVVLREKGNESETCNFLIAHYRTINYSQTENEPLECCANSEYMSATWWNNVSGEVLSFTSNSITTNLTFLCIENTNSSKAVIFKVVSLDFQDYGDGYEIALAKSPSQNEQHNNSTDELRCEAINVNIIPQASTDFMNEGVSEISTIHTTSQWMSSTHSSQVSLLTMLISVTAVSTSAFVCSICVIFTILYYYNYLRKDKYHVSQNRSTDRLTSLAAEEEDASESRSHDMTSFSSHTPQPTRGTNVHQTVPDQMSASLDSSCSGHVTMQSSSEYPGKHRTLPVLCEMQDSSPALNNSIPNIPHGSGCVDASCMGNVFEDKDFGQQDDGHPFLMPTSLENAYSSVDDAKDLTIFTKAGNEPSKPTTFLEPLQSSYVHDGARPDGDKISDSSSLRDKPKEMSVEMVAGNLTQPAVQLDAMYAQPDMSRKTKIKGKTSQLISQVSSEGVCGGGPSDPTEDAFQNTPSASYHLYSSVPTDMYGCDNTAGIFESTCEGDLYMNSSVHRFE